MCLEFSQVLTHLTFQVKFRGISSNLQEKKEAWQGQVTSQWLVGGKTGIFILKA